MDSLSIETTETGDVLIRGSRDSLLMLVEMLSKLALTNDLGDHIHIDEASIADPGSVPSKGIRLHLPASPASA